MYSAGDASQLAHGLTDGVAEPRAAEWQRLAQQDRFAYGFNTSPNGRQGYIISTKILLWGHETCGCLRHQVPDKIQWFLEHRDGIHGRFPLHCRHYDQLREDLRQQLPALRPGWVVSVDEGDVSYGSVIECSR